MKTLTAVLAALALTIHTNVKAQELFTITGYCLTGTTRTGTPTYDGVVAVDPNVIPLYSTLIIEGLPGTYTALDTGGGVVGRHIDVWFASCERAINYGRQYHEVYVLE